MDILPDKYSISAGVMGHLLLSQQEKYSLKIQI